MVGKPRRPEDILCRHCQQPGPWASSEQVEAWNKEQEKKRQAEEAQAAAKKRYSDLVVEVLDGHTELAPALKEAASQSGYSFGEQQTNALASFRGYVDRVLDDNLLSEEERDRVLALVPALDLTWDAVNLADPTLQDRLVIAAANSGRLPTAKNSILLTKAGEVVHYEVQASLMKEVTLREWRAGYSGFSIPIGKTGIRYKIGGARGHSVVVGTEWQAADNGTLSITSRRAVFSGLRKTMEFAYSKLANLSVFSNGVQFHVTNRQTAPLFTVPSGEVLAALVNAAMQHADGD